jgi:hypothetical protein
MQGIILLYLNFYLAGLYVLVLKKIFMGIYFLNPQNQIHSEIATYI